MDRHEIVQLVASQTRNTVQTGPFRGMKLSSIGCWGDGDIAAKLMGVYEQELHPYIDEFAKQDYDEIVDVGSAEGYYAVGCAMLFKSAAAVRAFDTNERSHAILHENARLNDVANRITISGLCSAENLTSIALGKRLLAVIDCEGGELALLQDPAAVSALKHSDLIIECHDFLDPAITGQLVGLLSGSHRISIIYSGARNPNEFPFLSHLSDVERWLAICEHRPTLMNWIVCTSKSPARA